MSAFGELEGGGAGGVVGMAGPLYGVIGEA